MRGCRRPRRGCSPRAPGTDSLRDRPRARSQVISANLTRAALEAAPVIADLSSWLADVEFDVPVRFDTDHMAVTIETYRLHAWQQIPIVELRT
jgi:Conserved hypothetical protein 2217 (DUF2460)